jgi:hypothetical protein
LPCLGAHHGPFPPPPPLQAHSSLKTIRKKLVRKVLDYLKKLADDEAKCKEDKKGDKEDKDAKDEGAARGGEAPSAQGAARAARRLVAARCPTPPHPARPTPPLTPPHPNPESKDDAACTRYSDFWREFGKAVKLGIIEDTTNRCVS